LNFIEGLLTSTQLALPYQVFYFLVTEKSITGLQINEASGIFLRRGVLNKSSKQLQYITKEGSKEDNIGVIKFFES
jgi:hypothetical protein